MSARPRKRTFPEIDQMNIPVVMGGSTVITLSMLIGLATRNGALVGVSLSVAVGAAIGWLAAGQASRRS